MGGHTTRAVDVADDDAAVLLRSRAEPECFADLFERYFAGLHGYASRRLDGAGGDDVAAETFLIAFRQRDRFDPARGSVRAWLYGIATNLIRARRREEAQGYLAYARAAAHPPDEPVHEEQTTDRVAAEAARKRIVAALAGLPERDRDALLLVVWGELSHEETAAALGIPVGTVGSRLHRARRRIRAALDDVNPTGRTARHG
ncbi:RNA polymerase sigma-70 factor (ECF subfamily) [Actinoplanes xinjiangensis]|jgi:RNA polymerase sigma factor (sigma-70 family)|uniref:RNA polymerase sigma-70 factor (ECF subfamily) n=1 Tax=Actinoplanes xinjiangensis TaxID=512350 RepID=A0A316FWP2_9ACTN|nr:RNA polymerase sigma-70 factor (ECF subfamily) [Actinoplanes xinjiangensis]